VFALAKLHVLFTPL